MGNLLKQVTNKKNKLDAHRPLPREVIKNLEDWYRIELTYTSNAIEGNTLSRAETALVIEKGITVQGKSLQEHLEAMNHAEALDYIRTLAGGTRMDIMEREVNQIHWLILKGIDSANAGKYRTVQVKIGGSDVELPIAVKIPELMENFYKWLHSDLKKHPVTIGADVHFKFVSIHPYIDGNGRTARLLMNLLLIQQGYPPAIIRKEDRKAYIDSIEKGQKTGAFDDYYQIIYKAVERSLDVYLNILEPKQSKSVITGNELLKIGELAKKASETIHTIRYWTLNGLLKVIDFTEGGYQLYDPSMIERVKEIRRLQDEKRLTIDEIRERFTKLEKK